MAARSPQVVVHGEGNGLVEGVAVVVGEVLVRRIEARWADAGVRARGGCSARFALGKNRVGVTYPRASSGRMAKSPVGAARRTTLSRLTWEARYLCMLRACTKGLKCTVSCIDFFSAQGTKHNDNA
jgi:hypothetical protein